MDDFDFDSFAGLKSKFSQYNVDYILSEPSLSLELIPDGTDVEPYFAPHNHDSQRFDSNSTKGSHASFDKLSIDHFEFLTMVGEGGFSNVFLVRKKDTGSIHAMKIVNKNKLLEHDREEYLFNEKNIWQSLDHPRIVRKTIAHHYSASFSSFSKAITSYSSSWNTAQEENFLLTWSIEGDFLRTRF